MRLPRFDYPLPPRQRGVFGLMAAGLMLLMVLGVALAVDTGRLFLEQRHMQRVADLAALEAAGAAPLISQATNDDLAEAAQDAASRNGHDSEDGKRALSTVGGGVCRAPEGDGWVRIFFPLDYGEPSEPCGEGYEGTLERHAVEVTASHQVRPSLFASLLGEDEITISATAMAQRSQAEQYAVFSVGSRLLSLDTDDSILSPILRGVLDLGVGADLLGFEGLADATVTLSDLLNVSELNVGSVEQLLSADLTLLQLVDAVAGAVGEEEVVGLSALANLVELHLPNVELVLGDILGVTTDTIPLMAELDVPELLSTALLVASQGNAVALPSLSLSVPGVTGIEAILEVIEPPQIAIGPVGCIDDAAPPCGGNWKTEARTAQLTLGVSADVEIPLLAELGLKLGVTAAGARAGIEDIRPAAEGDVHDWDVDVAAYQAPLTASADLSLSVLSTPLPRLDGSDWSANYQLENRLSQLGVLGEVAGHLANLATSIAGLLVDIITGLVNGLLSLLGGLLNPYNYPESRYYNAETEEYCLTVKRVGKISGTVYGSRTDCKPASYFDDLSDELGSSGGQTDAWQDDMLTWFESGEAQQHGTPMSPPVHTLAWPSDKKETFEGSLGDTATALGNLADTINVRAELFGVDLGVSNLLSPLLGIVDAVVSNVVGSLAVVVLDPLLDALGVNISEAEVRVIHIDHRTGPPELL